MEKATQKFGYKREHWIVGAEIFVALLLSVGANYLAEALTRQSPFHEWRTLLALVGGVLVALILIQVFLIQVFVFFLTSQSAKVSQLQQAVSRAYLEALDKSPFNPATQGRKTYE